MARESFLKYTSRNGSHWTDFRSLDGPDTRSAIRRGASFVKTLLLAPFALSSMLLIRLLLPLLTASTDLQNNDTAESPDEAYDPAIDEALSRFMDKANPDVSIVVPFYNRVASVSACLGSLARQQLPPGLSVEIVAVDNNSSDGTRDALAQYKSIKLVDCPRKGPGAARNEGLKIARAPVVAFTDSDCAPSEHWLASLVRAFYDEDVLIAGGPIRAARLEAAPAMFSEFHHVLDNCLFAHGSRYSPPFFATACAAFRKRSLDAVQGFDERIVMSEDADLCWRVLDLGGALVYQPDALVYHAHRETLTGLFRQAVGYGVASVQLISKHRGNLDVTWAISAHRVRQLALAPFTVPFAAVTGRTPYERREGLCIAVWQAGFVIGALKASIRYKFLFI